MKKIIGILSLVLLMALMLGAIIGTSVSAAEETKASAPAGAEWIVSANVAYKDNIYPYFAINSALAENTALLELQITEADGTSASYIPIAADVDIYGNGSAICHVVAGPGVAAKDMADELKIAVIYNGETVAEKTYSVAQYFYERLYNNGFINATGEEDLARRELYLASLAYGAAAQDLLSSTDELLLYDALYIDGAAAGVPTLNDKNDFVNIDEGAWRVVSFLEGGSVVTSYVTGGTFLVQNPCIIRPYSAYEIPEGAETFENIAESDISYESYTNANEGSPTYVSVSGIANAAIGFAINTNTNIKGAITLKQDETGNTYLNVDKEGRYTSSGANLVSNFDMKSTVDAGEDKVFELRLRTPSPVQGSGKYYFRLYDRSNNQLCPTSIGIEHSASTTKVYSIIESYDSELGKNTTVFSKSAVRDIAAGEWMTLRIVIHESKDIDIYASDSSGALVHAYTIPHEIYGVNSTSSATKTYDKAYSSTTRVRMFADSGWIHETDLDNIYFGGELPITQSMLYEENTTFSDKTQYNHVKYAEFDDKNGNGIYDSANDGEQTLTTKYAYYEDGSPVLGFKGTTYTYKDIFTNRTMFTVIDTVKDGGNSGKGTLETIRTLDIGNCDLYFYAKDEPTGNTVVFEIDILINPLADGRLIESQSHFNTIFYKDSSDTGNKVFQAYFGKQSVSLNAKTSTGYIKNSAYTNGVWTTLRYEYTTIGVETEDTSDDYFCSRVYVNDVLALERVEWFDPDTSKSDNPVYSATSINVIRIQPSKSFIGIFNFRNASISYKTVEAPK